MTKQDIKDLELWVQGKGYVVRLYPGQLVNEKEADKVRSLLRKGEKLITTRVGHEESSGAGY